MMGKSVLWGEIGGKPFEAQGKREKTNLDTKGNKVLRSLRKGEKEDGQIRTIDAAGAPGGNPARGFHEAAGVEREQAGAGVARAGDAHWGNCARAAAETALRLARYFKTNAEFWLNLQNFYDLEVTRRPGKVLEIERQVQPVGAE